MSQCYCCFETSKDDLITTFGVQAGNIHIINNYVDRENIRIKAQETIENFTFLPERKYIMNIGRFPTKKHNGNY